MKAANCCDGFGSRGCNGREVGIRFGFGKLLRSAVLFFLRREVAALYMQRPRRIT